MSELRSHCTLSSAGVGTEQQPEKVSSILTSLGDVVNQLEENVAHTRRLIFGTSPEPARKVQEQNPIFIGDQLSELCTQLRCLRNVLAEVNVSLEEEISPFYLIK